MTVAVVPVKSLATAKSRLLPHLGADAARRLSLTMLADVLEALLGVEELGRVGVVTPDADVAAAARAAGAEALLRPDPGLNAAIESACEEICAPGEAALVVLGDVAGARSEELSELLAQTRSPGVGLAPSRDGGTAALLRRPHDAVACAFGADSAKRHRAAADTAGVPLCELPLPSLAIDLDAPEDLAAFVAGSGAGRRTRGLLHELGLGGA